VISNNGAAVKIQVIPTNEELIVARASYEKLNG